MKTKINQYFYIDINLVTKKLIGHGISDTATLTGETNDPEIHRVFLTEGQYNKLNKKLD